MFANASFLRRMLILLHSHGLFAIVEASSFFHALPTSDFSVICVEIKTTERLVERVAGNKNTQWAKSRPKDVHMTSNLDGWTSILDVQMTQKRRTQVIIICTNIARLRDVQTRRPQTSIRDVY